MAAPIDFDIDLVKLLLDTTYTICGFAIAQALAYLYMIEKTEIRPQILIKKTSVLNAIIAFHAIYIAGIIFCHHIIYKIVSDPNVNSYYAKTFLLIGGGQAIIILMFGIFTYFITKTLQPK